MNNIDEILSVDGIDGVFIGPYDLSGSMGMLGDVTNEKVQEKCNFIAVGIDSATLANATKANYDLLNNLS